MDVDDPPEIHESEADDLYDASDEEYAEVESPGSANDHEEAGAEGVGSAAGSHDEEVALDADVPDNQGGGFGVLIHQGPSRADISLDHASSPLSEVPVDAYINDSEAASSPLSEVPVDADISDSEAGSEIAMQEDMGSETAASAAPKAAPKKAAPKKTAPQKTAPKKTAPMNAPSPLFPNLTESAEQDNGEFCVLIRQGSNVY